MPRVAESFDPQSIEWRHITDPNEKAFLIDFEYSLLGYDAENGRLDMLLRFPDNGGHCRRHRHIAATATLVLEGEQHGHCDGDPARRIDKNRRAQER